MKYSQLWRAQGPMKKLGRFRFEGSVQIKVARRLAWFNQHIDDVESVRQMILEDYMEKDEEGNPVPVEGQENRVRLADPEAYNAEMKALMSTEVSDFDPQQHAFTSEELGKIKGDDGLQPEEIVLLGPLVLENEETHSRAEELLGRIRRNSGNDS